MQIKYYINVHDSDYNYDNNYYYGNGNSMNDD